MNEKKKFKVDMYIGLRFKNIETIGDLYESLIIEANDFKEAESKFYKEVSIYPRSHYLEINELHEAVSLSSSEEEESTKMEFECFENITHEDGEKALVEKATGKVILYGDYYHNKIEYRIKGFFTGLSHVGVDYTLRHHQIDASHEMFNKLGFYDGSED